MTATLTLHQAGPGVTVQDRGRPGYLSQGLSRGGAADPLALAEGAALLGQDAGLAALELTGFGGVFEVSEDTRIALTGAPMRAHVDGTRLAWNASHLLPKGARLSIGAAEAGNYGYLSLGGGIDLPECLGARGTHLAANLGRALVAGDVLPLGADRGQGRVGMCLAPEERFSGGAVRLVPSLQTDHFDDDVLARFEASAFRRDTRGNRMGARLLSGGEGYALSTSLSILSEVIVPGDVQITGDGTPFVLLCECQTTGGYPRIGSVLPCDLPRVVQARPGDSLRFRFVDLASAVAAERQARARAEGLRQAVRPLVRDPHRMQDLLSYNLVGGVTAGDDMERGEP